MTYSFQRYPRSAAIKARKRIQEQYGVIPSTVSDNVVPPQNELPNTNKSQKSRFKPITEGKTGKISAYISKMLNAVTSTECLKEKAEYANNIYQMMLKYPAFLVDHPSYRMISYNKLLELIKTIEKDTEQYTNSTITPTMNQLISQVTSTIYSQLFYKPILEKLNEVKMMLKDYEVAIARTELMHTLKKAKTLYESITA